MNAGAATSQWSCQRMCFCNEFMQMRHLVRSFCISVFEVSYPVVASARAGHLAERIGRLAVGAIYLLAGVPETVESTQQWPLRMQGTWRSASAGWLWAPSTSWRACQRQWSSA